MASHDESLQSNTHITAKAAPDENWTGSTALSLLEALWANDETGWQRLVRLYTPMIYHWCRASGLSPDDSADVSQDVLRAVLTGISRFDYNRPNSTFRGWLRQITKNRVLDHYRWYRRQPKVANLGSELGHLEHVPSRIEHAFDAASETEYLSPTVQKAILEVRNGFEITTWKAFWLTTVDEKTPADVAEDIGVSVNAVYLAKSRVLRQLRSILGELLPAESKG